MFNLVVTVSALVASVVSLHLPTRITAVDGLTNAERLAKGFAPAWPQSLQHYARSQNTPRLRRQGGPGPSATPTPTCQPPQAQPTVVLTNPVPLYTGDNNWDDDYRSIVLPFPIQIYDRTSTTIFVSTNGLLSFDAGSPAYFNSALPDSESIAPYTVLPFCSCCETATYILDV